MQFLRFGCRLFCGWIPSRELWRIIVGYRSLQDFSVIPQQPLLWIYPPSVKQ